MLPSYAFSHKFCPAAVETALSGLAQTIRDRAPQSLMPVLVTQAHLVVVRMLLPDGTVARNRAELPIVRIVLFDESARAKGLAISAPDCVFHVRGGIAVDDAPRPDLHLVRTARMHDSDRGEQRDEREVWEDGACKYGDACPDSPQPLFSFGPHRTEILPDRRYTQGRGFDG